MPQNSEIAPLIHSICEQAIKDLYRAGKINCIKFVRSLTYTDLKTTKEYVESVMQHAGLSFPSSDWELEQKVNSLQIENDSIKRQLRNIIEGY